MGHKSEKYRFAKEKQINCLGMDIESGNLYEWIGDHTKKILQEQESTLKKMPGTGDSFMVQFIRRKVFHAMNPS